MNARKTIANSWWTVGDMPVRAAPYTAFLVDGRMTMLEMCICFMRARHTIHITAFGLSPELLLVRGKHKCAGPAGSVEQETLLNWLQKKGLSAEDLRFWQDCEELSVTNVLRYAVNKGVRVRVLLWDTYTLPFHPGPKDVQKTLEAIGVSCVLDDSHKGLLNHPFEAHHQKTVVVDNRLAFVGGIDMMVSSNGEFDRWDTKGHPYHTFLRLNKEQKMPHSWHDTHILIGGLAVADVEFNFRQRWNAVARLHKAYASLLFSRPSRLHKVVSRYARHREHPTTTASIQVLRTIPKGTYTFAPEDGIATILDAYRRAFAQAKRHIYLENQYLWQRTFLGFENPTLGIPHTDMEGLLHALAEALTRGVVVTLVLPDNPNVGREFTDEGLQALWKLAPQARETGTLQVYTLGSSMQQEDQTYYRSIYVHAKTTIVDDTWITLGSANLNNRGMRDDTELNVALQHPELAQHIRILLMAEHLGLCHEDTLFQLLNTFAKTSQSLPKNARQLQHRARLWSGQRKLALAATHEVYSAELIDKELAATWEMLITQLGDPLQGTALFARQAQENLLAVKAGQPITGHLLPYVPHVLAKEYQVEVNAVKGWLDILPEPAIRPVEDHIEFSDRSM